MNTLNDFDELFDFVAAIFKNTHYRLSKAQIKGIYGIVSLYHIARALSLLDSIRLLCGNGHTTESRLLLRSLLNLFINYIWITRDETEARLKRFADFEIIFNKLLLDEVLPYSKNKIPMTDEEYNKRSTMFSALKTKYNLNNKKDFYSWSGRSIKEMAKECGLLKDYTVLYSPFSDIDHTGPLSIREYVQNDPETGLLKLTNGIKHSEIPHILLRSAKYILDLKLVVFCKLKCELIEYFIEEKT